MEPMKALIDKHTKTTKDLVTALLEAQLLANLKTQVLANKLKNKVLKLAAKMLPAQVQPLELEIRKCQPLID